MSGGDTVYPGFPVLLHPLLQKGTCFLLWDISVYRSIPTDAVQFVTLDFCETVHPHLLLCGYCLVFFHGVLAFCSLQSQRMVGVGVTPGDGRLTYNKLDKITSRQVF